MKEGEGGVILIFFIKETSTSIPERVPPCYRMRPFLLVVG